MEKYAILKNYIPEAALPHICEILEHDALVVKVKQQRRTKHGDYRPLPNGKHQITINNNLNAYRFLLTLVHEIAHFEAYKKYGYGIKPHGKEWKHTFQRLILPFLNPEIFPKEVLPLLAEHFKNPKASSDTDEKLSLALKKYDTPNDKTYIFEVPFGSVFKVQNGRTFKKGNKRRKRFECIEIKTGKLYLFNPNAKVELIDNFIPSEEGISRMNF